MSTGFDNTDTAPVGMPSLEATSSKQMSHTTTTTKYTDREIPGSDTEQYEDTGKVVKGQDLDDNTDRHEYSENDDTKSSYSATNPHDDNTSEASEDPKATYEDIGIGRKYFDHEYFLQYHGLAQEEYISFGNGPKNSGRETAKGALAETTSLRTVETIEKNSEMKAHPSSEITTGSTEMARGKKDKKLFGFHEDEDAWLALFFKKIKAVLDSGKSIEMPSDAMMYKLFNEFFEGKVLKDAEGQLLPPCVGRYTASIYNHLRSHGNVETFALREEVLTLLEEDTGGQLYVPVITDEEIRQYRSRGTVIADDPSDARKNMGLALSAKEIKFNKSLRVNANLKRKRDARDTNPPSPK